MHKTVEKILRKVLHFLEGAIAIMTLIVMVGMVGYEVYKMIRRAFRGGNTHCSRFYTGVVMDNVTSYDRVSSYPDCLVNYPYPVKPFVQQKCKSIDELEDGSLEPNEKFKNSLSLNLMSREQGTQ